MGRRLDSAPPLEGTAAMGVWDVRLCRAHGHETLSRKVVDVDVEK